MLTALLGVDAIHERYSTSPVVSSAPILIRIQVASENGRHLPTRPAHLMDKGGGTLGQEEAHELLKGVGRHYLAIP